MLRPQIPKLAPPLRISGNATGSTVVLFSSVIGTVGTLFKMYRFWYRRYFFLAFFIGTRYSVLLLLFFRNVALIYSNSVQIK